MHIGATLLSFVRCVMVNPLVFVALRGPSRGVPAGELDSNLLCYLSFRVMWLI